MRLRTLLVATLLLATACETPKKRPVSAAQSDAFAPRPITDADRIADYEDRRSLGDGRVVGWALTANDPADRARALLALGRIQDPSTAGTLVKGLTDPDPGARGEAAFAIGLLGLSWQPLPDEVKARLAEALRAAEPDEKDPGVKLLLLEALGRVGTAAALERLVDRLSVPGDVQARAALSLGVAAKAGAKLPARALGTLGGLLKKDHPPATRYGAAYGLARSRDPGARSFLVLCAADDASEVRAVCAKGLGEVGSELEVATLRRLLDDPDYRVAVEATSSLARLAEKCRGSCAALTALGDLNLRVERFLRGDTAGGAQPLLALAQAGLPAPAGKAVLLSLRSQLLAGVKDVKDEKLRRDLANVECRFAAALDQQALTVQEVVSCGGGLVPESQRIATALTMLGEAQGDPTRRAREVGAYVLTNDPRVKLAALNALAEIGSPTSIDKVRTQLNAEDPTIAAAAAAALGKLNDRASVPQIRGLAQKAVEAPDLAPALAEALTDLDAKDAAPDLEAWLGSSNATVRLEAAKALGKLKGTRVAAPRVERKAGGTRPPPLPDDASLLVRTSKGEFEVKLYTRDAPLTAINAVSLARKGFFRGLTFHRVVPDFVVQGGDPRGDGEGGPGYTIRCEVNHRPYGRGVVGMALGGKDTGGSQFFVTAAPQPHLDGRYTAFGEVTKGQEVVDTLLEGDVIEEVRAVP